MSYKAILKEEITCEEASTERVYASLDELWEAEPRLAGNTLSQKNPHEQRPIPLDIYQYVLDNEDRIRVLLEYWKHELCPAGLLQAARLEDLTCIYMNCLELERTEFDEGEGVEEENYIS